MFIEIHFLAMYRYNCFDLDKIHIDKTEFLSLILAHKTELSLGFLNFARKALIFAGTSALDPY